MVNSTNLVEIAPIQWRLAPFLEWSITDVQVLSDLVFACIINWSSSHQWISTFSLAIGVHRMHGYKLIFWLCSLANSYCWFDCGCLSQQKVLHQASSNLCCLYRQQRHIHYELLLPTLSIWAMFFFYIEVINRVNNPSVCFDTFPPVIFGSFWLLAV